MKTVFALSVALAVSGFLTMESFAQSSCAAFQSQCVARCGQRNEPVAKCTADHCTPKLVTCRKTGCWTEGARYGGATVCNLAK